MVMLLLICFVAGISFTAFIVIWFHTAYKELVHARQCVENAAMQIQLYKDKPIEFKELNRLAATQGLDTAQIIYHEVCKSYNAVRSQPMNRVPAIVLGFRYIKEE